MKPTTEDVLKWAREVEIEVAGNLTFVYEMSTHTLEKLAALAYAAGAAAEREMCAKVCEGEKMGGSTGMVHVDEAINETALACATAIRARGEKNE